jgi:E3 ubiquitin-protein ligase HUWE1
MEPISVLASPLSDTALNYQFYGKKEDGGKEGLIVINFANPASMIKGGGSSPRRQSKRTSTTVVHENEKELEEWIIKEYGVPEKHRFAVKHRLMRALVNASGVEAEIERLKEVRMLAVGIWVNMIGEDVAQSKIFLYEPDLVSKCADVLRDGNYASQTTALYVLDSVARYRGKQGEVCLAVNIGASHGVLMVALQKVMAYFAQEGNEGKVIPMEFIDALFGLVSLLSSQVASAQAVNSSGLVGMLVGALENYKVDQRRSVCRCLGILDSVLFQPSASSTANSNTAHGLFTAAKGIELIVERLKYEVGECCKEGGGEDMMDIDGRGEIPYDRVSLLRGMLRLVLHLMQGSGTVDGVRNLIEGGLPGSLLKIIAGEGFPASVFCIGIFEGV